MDENIFIGIVLIALFVGGMSIGWHGRALREEHKKERRGTGRWD